MGNMFLRGFRNWYPEETTSGQNIETNFSFITIFSRAAPVVMHTCVHSFV